MKSAASPTSPGARTLQWTKTGLIFDVTGQYPWMAHHASVPIPEVLAADRLRVYFSPRDPQGRARPGFFDVDPDDPSTVLYLHDRPVLDLGRPGSFDDNGVMGSCVVNVDGAKYLYYNGWTPGGTVPYRNAIGLAVSIDGGNIFERVHEAPVLDRDSQDPFSTHMPFVMRDGSAWQMWYMATTRWQEYDGRYEPVYLIKHAVSGDGITWRRTSRPCIAPTSPDEAIGIPRVVRDGQLYRMWYSYRATTGFRTELSRSYRIGYAESDDGLDWQRMDQAVGIGPSETGWDSEMVEYAAVYDHDGRRHMLYNGNGFGMSGIGHAVAAP
jgi:hypothetical protein